MVSNNTQAVTKGWSATILSRQYSLAIGLYSGIRVDGQGLVVMEIKTNMFPLQTCGLQTVVVRVALETGCS